MVVYPLARWGKAGDFPRVHGPSSAGDFQTKTGWWGGPVIYQLLRFRWRLFVCLGVGVFFLVGFVCSFLCFCWGVVFCLFGRLVGFFFLSSGSPVPPCRAVLDSSWFPTGECPQLFCENDSLQPHTKSSIGCEGVKVKLICILLFPLLSSPPFIRHFSLARAEKQLPQSDHRASILSCRNFS